MGAWSGYRLRWVGRPEVGLRVIAIRTEGLGNSSYLLTHEGVGVLVDLQVVPPYRRRRAPSWWFPPGRRPSTGTVPPSTWRTSRSVTSSSGRHTRLATPKSTPPIWCCSKVLSRQCSPAGRTDLVGAERAESLARLQYLSVNRLARLSPQIDLYPTHGAGSFCTATATSTETKSTIGGERRSNPVLVHESEEAFVKSQLAPPDTPPTTGTWGEPTSS